MEWCVLAAALFLAFMNGANDNFKGVATLYGSGTLSHRQALALASVSTLAGALLSLSLAAGLMRAFSGKGIVPSELLDAPLLASIGLAAATTVLLATRLGFPVSTTHALVGGIAGAGFAAAGASLEIGALARAFLVPLLLGPVLAIALARAGLRVARAAAQRLAVDSQTCICVGHGLMEAAVACPVHTASAALLAPTALRLNVGESPGCSDEYVGPVARVTTADTIRAGHLLSASLVGFARGLNDTPKILGLVAGLSLISPVAGTLAIAFAMTLGGLAAGRRVAETLSKKITPMTPGQGLVGNLATSALVIGASRLGLPVSTTHVSTGAIMGIGGSDGSLHGRAVRQVLAAWVTTLPVAAVLGAGLMWGQRWL